MAFAPGPGLEKTSSAGGRPAGPAFGRSGAKFPCRTSGDKSRFATASVGVAAAAGRADRRQYPARSAGKIGAASPGGGKTDRISRGTETTDELWRKYPGIYQPYDG